MYPASMANSRSIDNNELHTLFTRIRAYYVSPRQCMTPLVLSVSLYRCLVPLRKGLVDDCCRLLLHACRALANLDWQNKIRQRSRWYARDLLLRSSTLASHRFARNNCRFAHGRKSQIIVDNQTFLICIILKPDKSTRDIDSYNIMTCQSFI